MVTLDATEEASLPADPGRSSSSSKDGRGGAGDREEVRSGGIGERNIIEGASGMRQDESCLVSKRFGHYMCPHDPFSR